MKNVFSWTPLYFQAVTWNGSELVGFIAFVFMLHLWVKLIQFSSVQVYKATGEEFLKIAGG